MTSRNSFFKLLREDMCRRKCELILSIIVFVIVLVLIPLQVMASGAYAVSQGIVDSKDYILQTLNVLFGIARPILYIVTIVASWICGFSGMSYLFSKSKTDLYHSIPVNREQLFLVSYVNSVLFYAVPYLVTLVLGLLSASCFYEEAVSMWTEAFLAYGYHLLGYTMLLNINLTLVMLSGRLLVAVLGMIASYGYGIVWYILLSLYRNTFLYCLVGENDINVIPILSPVCNYMLSGALAKEIGLQSYIWLMAVITVVCFITARIFYLKRSSCASGGTIAFAKIKPFIKGCVMLPLALLGGVMLYLIYHKFAYWVFGAVFVIAVAHVALQGILEQADIRAIAKGLKTVGIVSVLALIITLTYYCDVFHVNRYIPDSEDIESCAVIVGTEMLSYSGDMYYGNEEVETAAKRMKITDVDLVLKLSKAGYETRKRFYKQEQGENVEACNFNVYYRLKNGKTVRRLYTLDNSEQGNMQILKKVLDSPEYKLGNWVYSSQECDGIRIYGYDKTGAVYSVSVDKISDRQEMFDALRVDIINSSVDTMQEESGLGFIKFYNNHEEIWDEEVSVQYFSKSYEHLMAFLEKRGFMTENIDTVSLPNTEKVTGIATMQYGTPEVVILDRDEIRSIMPYLTWNAEYFPTQLYGTVFENTTDIKEVYVQSSDGIYCAVLKPDAPQWVKERFEILE